MIKQFTLTKSSISNIQSVQQQIDNYQMLSPSVHPAVGQTGIPADWQGVALNFFFVIITFFIVAMTPSFQALNAQESHISCETVCGGDGECEERLRGETATEYDCNNLKIIANKIKGAGQDRSVVSSEERSEDRSICPTAGSSDVGQCERDVRERYRDAENELLQAKNRIRQERRADQDQCRNARRDVRKIAGDLPPECVSSGGAATCLTDRERCRNLRQRLGSLGGFFRTTISDSGVTPQQLALDCPQAAAAKFDNDNERLSEVTDDLEESQQEVFDLENQLREGVTKAEADRLRLETDIQNSRNQMARATHEFDSRVQQMNEQLSGQVAGLANGAAQINQQIRGKVTELERLQSEDNAELDLARVAYKDAIDAIFGRCQAIAKEAVERLRSKLNEQRNSGKDAKTVEDATQQNRLDRLRDAAIRAYAKCRGSSDTLIEVQRAQRQYQLVERALDRKQQEIIDEINSLKEQHATIGGQTAGMNDAVNQAYATLERQHFDTLEQLTQEMQLKNFEKQGLSASFNEEQRQLQQRLAGEVSNGYQLNGEMVALRQTVEGSRINSAFGNLNYDDYRRFDEYDQERQNAQEVCCVPGLQENNTSFCPSSSRSRLGGSGTR